LNAEKHKYLTMEEIACYVWQFVPRLEFALWAGMYALFVAIGALTAYLRTQVIDSGDLFTSMAFAICGIAESLLVTCFIHSMNRTMSCHTRCRMTKESLERYARTTHSCRRVVSIEEYRTNMMEALGAVEKITTWGLSTIWRILYATLQLGVSFYNRDSIHLLLVLVVWYVIGYLFFVRDHLEKHAKLKKTNEDRADELAVQARFELRDYQNGYFPLEKMVNLEATRSGLYNELSGSYSKTSQMMSMINDAPVVLVIWMMRNQTKAMIDLIMALQSIHWLFEESIFFFGELDDYRTKITKFLKDLKRLDSDVAVNYQSEPLPEVLTVDRLAIHVKDESGAVYDVQYAPNSKPIVIRRGGRYVVRGRKGAGKSLLFASLAGLSTSSASAGGVDLARYRHQLMYHEQDITSSSTAKLTLRMMFSGASDDVIKEYLELCGVGSWASKLETTIDRKPSGGERSGIFLAHRLWLAVTRDIKIIYLDEPETGFDVDGFVAVFNAIKRRFPDLTIVLITHLLDETVSQLGPWNGRVGIVREGSVGLVMFTDEPCDAVSLPAV